MGIRLCRIGQVLQNHSSSCPIFVQWLQEIEVRNHQRALLAIRHRSWADFATVSAALAQEQHGDDAQRDEQADGGPVVEQLGRPGETRRGAGGGDRLASLDRCGDSEGG